MITLKFLILSPSIKYPRPIRAFYLGRVLVGIIREVDNEHIHEFYGLSGEGRVLTKIEFWARIKIVKASQHFVVTKGLIYKPWL